jgi:hypothetical protein
VNGNHCLGLKLIDGPKPPDAIKAKVFLSSGGIRQRGDIFSDGSYGSNSDPRVHFGLGRVSKVERVEIYLPTGTKQEIRLPAVDRIFTVDEMKALLPQRDPTTSQLTAQWRSCNC